MTEAGAKPAPLPSNEVERLRELQAFRVLDVLPEQPYDDITALAAEICGTPIALVSLVDETRQRGGYRRNPDQADRPTTETTMSCLREVSPEADLPAPRPELPSGTARPPYGGS